MKNNSTDRILAKLEEVSATKPGHFMARCPAHDDQNASLSIREVDDKVLVNCFAGCKPQDVMEAIGLSMKDLFDEPDSWGRHSATPKGPELKASSQMFPSRPQAIGAEPPKGLTLEQYAAAKHLPVDLLRTLELRDDDYLGVPALMIPYLNEDLTLDAMRVRLSLDGPDKFRWQAGSKPTLYGRQFLPAILERQYVVIVEGESDAHTCWHNYFPALGLPGSNTWDEERDAPLLKDVKIIYAIIEPDQGGKAMLEWISKSSIRDRVRLIFMQDYKDISELFLAAPGAFARTMKATMAVAVPFQDFQSAERRRLRAHFWRRCRGLAESGKVLDAVLAYARSAGIAGEDTNIALTFLALTTRLFKLPTSLIFKGTSSSGKSCCIDTVLSTVPASAVIRLTGGSNKSMVYDAEQYSHRFLYFSEADGIQGDFYEYALRSLLSEGKLHYKYTSWESGKGGKVINIEKEGPTGVVITTTKVVVHPENETRLLSLSTSDTPEQTKASLLAIAKRDGNAPPAPEELLALQEWLTNGPTEVCVPFAEAIAEFIPPYAPRLRRDFSQVLQLIKAHALLSQANRKKDNEGRIIATIEDYAVIYGLLADILAEGVEASVPDIVKETVEAVQDICNKYGKRHVTYHDLMVHMRVDRGTVSRRVSQASSFDLLTNLETRPGVTARVELGPVDLFEKVSVLPPPERVKTALESSGAS